MKPNRPDRPKQPHNPQQKQQQQGGPRPQPGKAAAAPTTDWGNVADWYNDLVGPSGSEYHQQVVLPNTLRLLNPKAGESALDAACGQGVLSRLLAARGVRVTGVDAARELIEAARHHPLPPAPAGAGAVEPPTYRVGDARDLAFLPESHFDLAACVLAIQNIHPIQPVFQTVARALKPGGRFVVVMMHPAFRGPGETHWGWDGEHNVQYRRVDRYLVPRKAPIVTHPGKQAGVYTWSFHKPIEAYVKAMRNAGLLVDALEEWPSHKTSTSGPRAHAENVARKEIPMFLAIRCLRLGTPVHGEPAEEVAG
jgi:ubiquinone/menaquinone biosynthesis C-methylase UbiE